MTKTINGDLILTEDTTFIESIIVGGDIKGYFDLKVIGDIDAWNINAWNIDAWNINAGNINAVNIDAWNINAWNIIFCGKIKVKKDCKVLCKQLITDRSNIQQKEWKVEEAGEQKA